MGSFFANARFHTRFFGRNACNLYAPRNTSDRHEGEAFGVGTWPAFLVALLIGEPFWLLYQIVTPVVLDWPGGVRIADGLSAVMDWAFSYADAHSTLYAWLPPGDATEIGFHYRADLLPAHDDPEYEQKRPRMWQGAATLTTLTTLTTSGTSYTVRYDGKRWTLMDGTPIQTSAT